MTTTTDHDLLTTLETLSNRQPDGPLYTYPAKHVLKHGSLQTPTTGLTHEDLQPLLDAITDQQQKSQERLDRYRPRAQDPNKSEKLRASAQRRVAEHEALLHNLSTLHARLQEAL